MAYHEISASARIPASASTVYRLIADYRDGHGRILPRPPFESLEVEKGGYGDGTIIRVRMKVLGRVRTFRAMVTEPEPGRTLVETNDTGYVTTFVVDPVEGGREARVTLASDMRGRGRLRGAIEKLLLGPMLRGTFEKELALLAGAAAGRRPAVPGE
ncbi:MAG: hypothetical protein GWM90_30570 [Gemmatimonadetes bacterium]|nr:SRPBCC family protein [Gemmatimonadota bacterium]NIQ59540.1 SRPBCC family protein [Gemmatimonadota bacterium]NIU79728.1 hypothetical protein [Gammaproteobacteria bacterium]NIX48249.1 hypothetical protein [Gemmatimonadota bacterium]NIY12690.1 hypothetical protein [Gemmatimonadota bacterium]